MTAVLGRADVLFGIQDTAYRRGLARVQQSAERVGQRLETVGRIARNMLIVGGGALAGFVKLASDAEEIASKFEAVFKEETKAAREFSVELAKAVGRSTIELQEYLAALQDTFVPMGFARKEARLLSQQLVALGIDVASFQNKAEPEVLRDFQSALVGNVETVRKYGIVITQARIGQELLNMGITAGVTNATEQQKVTARLNLILQGTTDAQGDAVRTAGSLANQFKAIRAAAKDAGIAIGQVFVPRIKETIRGFREAIPKITEWVKANRANILVTTKLTAQLLIFAVVIPKITRAVGALILVLRIANSLLLTMGVGLAALALGVLVKDIHDVRLATEKLNLKLLDQTSLWQQLGRARKDFLRAETAAARTSAGEQRLEAIDTIIKDKLNEIQDLQRRIRAVFEARAEGTGIVGASFAAAAVRELGSGIPDAELKVERLESNIARLRDERQQVAADIARNKKIATEEAAEEERKQRNADRKAAARSRRGRAEVVAQAGAPPIQQQIAASFVGLTEAFKQIQTRVLSQRREERMAKAADKTAMETSRTAANTSGVSKNIRAIAKDMQKSVDLLGNLGGRGIQATFGA